MACINIRDPNQRVSFQQAVELGIGRNQGLFLPETLQPLDDVPALLGMDFASRSARILAHLVGDDMEPGGGRFPKTATRWNCSTAPRWRSRISGRVSWRAVSRNFVPLQTKHAR